MTNDPAGPDTAKPTTPTGRKASEAALSFAIEVARLIRDDKCEDVLVLNVAGLSPVTDVIIIGSGTSDRQMRSSLEHVRELGDEHGYGGFRSNTDTGSTWVVADFVDVVCHIFEPNTRAHYDLEMLWGDAERVAWERPGEADRNLAGLRPDEQIDPS